MINIIDFFSDLVFVFCLLGVVRLTFNFVQAVLSNPPKQFTLTNFETITHGVILSYIITYLIHSI